MRKRLLSDYCSDEFKALYEEYSSTVSNPRTLYEYTGYINLLCDYLGKDFLEIGDEDAERYRAYMIGRMNDGGLTRQTVCVRLSCYKAVARYIEDLEYLDYYNPFENIRRPELRTDLFNPQKIPTMRELDTIMTEAKSDPTLYVVLALATRAAFSATSIVKIKKEYLVYENDRLFIYIPPANELASERYVMLPVDVQSIVENYVANNENPDREYLFYNKHGNPLTIRNIDAMVSRLIKRCGFNGKYTMKDFRNRAILELAEAGGNPEDICSYSGLRRMRVNAFINSSGLVSGKCPADLVNYQLKPQDSVS